MRMVAGEHRHVVLIVEDHADMRDAVATLAGSLGLDTREAANGQEALELLRAGLRPCLILLDLRMPVMNGFEFRRQQLADPSLARIPVAIVSGGGIAAETAARRLNPDAFFRQPVEPDKLVKLLTSHCEGRRTTA